MQSLPHQYPVVARASSDSSIALSTPNCQVIQSAAPAEFGGPGDLWSPETLLVGAVADCFILVFRAIARASDLNWTDLQCSANGTLDKVERVTQFTEIHLAAKLTVPEGTDIDKARTLLEKAERSCLVSNSLSSEIHLECQVVID